MSAYDDAVAYLDAVCSDMRDIVDEMEAENAKLRELARDLWMRLVGTDDDGCCGDCRVCNYDAFNYENPKCVYNERMRELGIEVEE